MRLIVLFVATLLAGGCATGGTTASKEGAPVLHCADEGLAADVVMHLDLIKDMQGQGLYHAALAHLDALDAQAREIPRARYLRAEALRHSGRGGEAIDIYESLTQGCLAALGNHGLARIAMDESRHEDALRHFRAAVQALPTDPRIRNDYGYALLLSGRAEEALPQFQTALELGGEKQTFVNRLLALLVLGRDEEALTLAKNAGLRASMLDGLHEQAKRLRGIDDG
jgi:Flp pilus assembly protein TadD